ncbi:MAG TPA: DUF4214 domain-containing protein [Pyrinomonadaceae bacterium]|nr:DUF4214 domain-containing protein [Pyrinomonadaceae bacterium]
MCIIKAKRAATFLALLLLTHLSIFAQDTLRENSTLQQNNPLGRIEVPDSEEQRRFVEEHSFNNPSFHKKQSERMSVEATTALSQGSKQVRVIYLVPADKSFRADYQNAIASAISHLQSFYRDQLGGGYAFSLHSPIVEVYQTPHTSAFYSTGNNSRPGGFYESVLADGFALTGGSFNDPNNRWIFYVDADLICGQYIGSTSGISLLPANDLRGLTSQPTVPICSTDRSEVLSVNRWIGGLGHELGHAFNLPHPPGCDDGNCTGGQYTYKSLMYVGYYYYPDTYLLDENKAQLLAGGFFNALTLDPAARYDISGRITNSDHSALAGATITINETQASVVSDANGNFNFTGLPSGGNYTISVTKAGYRFTPNVLFNNLDRNQIANFTGTPEMGSLQFNATNYSANENDGSVTIIVNRTGNASGPAMVNYSTTDNAGLNQCGAFNGIASSRCDYATSARTLQFGPGETSRAIFIPLIDDSYAEGNETFDITLRNPSGENLGPVSTATITIIDNDAMAGSNPVDSAPFFVRQHYIDFLGREPDSFGNRGWQDILNNCAAGDTKCDRTEVSAGFFRSSEFQERGYFTYRFYSVALGRKPNYSEFMPDLAKVSGFLTDAEKEANKVAFVDEFMQRPEFRNKYDSTLNNPTAYVDALLTTAGLQNHPSRAGWIAGLTNGSLTRAQVLRQMAESSEAYERFYTEAFVVMQYFGYLRRDPDKFYLDWIAIMNQDKGNYRNMVSGFMNSTEYKARFGR